MAITRPVAGSRTSNVCPSAASTGWPPITIFATIGAMAVCGLGGHRGVLGWLGRAAPAGWMAGPDDTPARARLPTVDARIRAVGSALRRAATRCLHSGSDHDAAARDRARRGGPLRVPSFGAIGRRHAVAWLVVASAIVAVGTAGYVVLQGWSVSDALYMTVITLTTVGFKEVADLDTVGRAWTMLLAIAAVGIIFGTVGLVAEALLSDATSGRREAKRMDQALAALRDHYIVCGYGRVGSIVARELVHGGHRVVVVDIRPESLEAARADGHLAVAGDGTSDAILHRAGVERAKGLVTSIDSDANNVFVTLSARAMNPGLFIVSRASARETEAKLSQAGADRVVSPYRMAGRRIAELAVRPQVADFIDAALSHGQLAFSMEEVQATAGGAARRPDGRRAARGRDLHPGHRPGAGPTTRTRPTTGSWSSARA